MFFLCANLLLFFSLEFFDLWALLGYGSFRECCWWSLLCLYKVIQWWAVVQLQWSTCQQGKEGFFKIIILKDRSRDVSHQQQGLLKMRDSVCPLKHTKSLRHTRCHSFVFVFSKFPLFLYFVLFWACWVFAELDSQFSSCPEPSHGLSI